MQIGMVSSNFKRFFSLTREQGMPPWWREVCLWDLRCAECFVALLRLFSTFFIEQLLLLNRAVATVPSLVKIVWRKLPCEPVALFLSVICFLDSRFCKVSGKVESGKFLLSESKILGFEVCNTAQGIRNSTADWNPKSTFHWQRIGNSVPGIRNPLRGIQNPKFPYRPLHGAAFY